MAESILIVEDEAATREGLAFHLRTLGYEVAVAEDGPTALTALQRRPADILLLDLVLPGEMDGIQVLRIAREIIPHVGAIVITGYPSAENTLEALRLRAYDYVIKPFDLDRLGHVLAHLVEKLRLERQVAEANGHLENIYRTNPVAVNAIDLAGRFTHCWSAF